LCLYYETFVFLAGHLHKFKNKNLFKTKQKVYQNKGVLSMKKVLSKFPPYILSRFENIPDPEKKNVLEQANLFGAEVINPDEEMIEAFDEVLRYKEAKISLVRLMLEGMIEDDINDRLEAKELASDLLNKYCLSEVIKVYEEKYRAEAN
jgi:hypothetical protein